MHAAFHIQGAAYVFGGICGGSLPNACSVSVPGIVPVGPDLFPSPPARMCRGWPVVGLRGVGPVVGLCGVGAVDAVAVETLF